MNCKAAIADKNNLATWQPTTYLQQALPCPIGQHLVPSEHLLAISF
ncbi:hypothetical protein CES86_4512 [Brucella lupini]|uniref:Uncharacterized protein n=1 Tax=Brucella lupini TaxID=255457 RepID=A0A256GCR0_9HYPH|nr:hypothetical protein CES86_4512 [Brucella lupini]